jgi:hypothetical protein
MLVLARSAAKPSCLAGDEVDEPFSAYCKAMVIDKHALRQPELCAYAELDQEDPKRRADGLIPPCPPVHLGGGLWGGRHGHRDRGAVHLDRSGDPDVANRIRDLARRSPATT